MSQAKETIGILPLPEKTRQLAGVTQYSPDDYSTKVQSKLKHRYLAEQQGTKFAVITVHSTEEKAHFAKFMTKSTAFALPNQSPDWREAVLNWNASADGETISTRYEEIQVWILNNFLII